jgi:hypothetical protein
MKTLEKKITGAALVLALLLPIKTFALDWSIGVGNTGAGSGYASGGWAASNVYGLPEGSIMGIVSNLLFWLLSMFALAGIIGFVLSGIFYLISAGEEDMITKAKDGMKWSIVGVIVGLSGFVIMQAVSAMLDGTTRNF